MLHLLAQPQKELQLDLKISNTQNQKNRAVWKFYNQGFKEATFIQAGRRGRDVAKGRDVQRRGAAWRGSGGTKGPTFTRGG